MFNRTYSYIQLFCHLITIVSFNVIYAENHFGCIQGNCIDGKGTYMYPPWDEQRKYIGKMLNESPNGSGTMYYKTGSEWAGTWELGVQIKKEQVRKRTKNNKQGGLVDVDGKMTFIWSDGRKYEGEHLHHKANGRGEYTHANGAVYTGSFKKGQKHGSGIMHYKDGDIYNGKWNESELIIESPSNKQIKIGCLFKHFIEDLGNGVVEEMGLTCKIIDGIAGATEYLYLLSENEDMSNPIEFLISPRESHIPFEIPSLYYNPIQTYYVQAIAMYNDDALGLPSEIRDLITGKIKQDIDIVLPKLRIDKITIDDDNHGDSQGNNNSTIDYGEYVEITAYVQNFGGRDATHVSAKIVLDTENKNIMSPDEGKIYDLGTIVMGDYREIEFSLFTTKSFKDIDIPLSINLSEPSGSFDKNIDLNLKTGERSENIVKIDKEEEQVEMLPIENIIPFSDDVKDSIIISDQVPRETQNTKDCPNKADIRVSNHNAKWQILDSQTNAELINGGGDEVVLLCEGKYILKEAGDSENFRQKEFEINNIETYYYVNLDLRRFDVVLLPNPNDVKWTLNNNELSIYKQGTGGEKIQDLLPGVYLINCEDSDGTLSGSSTIEINENNQLIEVDCFSSCTSPVIEIQLSPAGTSWDVESSDGIADYTSYHSGTGYMKIPVELGQLYRLKAQHNNIERTSDVVSFTSLDAKCSEIIDIKMDSYSILLDDACSDSNWKEVIRLDKELQNRDNSECSHYLCLSQAYSENGNDEKALDIILEGWNMVDDKRTCLSFHTDEEYIYNLLFFAEKYGLTEANIQIKEIDDKVKRIIEMPLRASTEMKALFVYLSIKIFDINHKKEIWNNSDMDFRNKNKDNYCMETEELVDGSYSIEKLEDLMELLGSFNYANTVENDYKIRLQKALKLFGC